MTKMRITSITDWLVKDSIDLQHNYPRSRSRFQGGRGHFDMLTESLSLTLRTILYHQVGIDHGTKSETRGTGSTMVAIILFGIRCLLQK
jgi:hypothetical protein